MDTCKDWDLFCQKYGISPWVVNEGGGDCQISLTTLEAHKLGIVKLPDWKVEE